MKIRGSILQIKTRINVSGDKVTTLMIEAHGDVSALHALMESPLEIEVNAE